MNKILIFCSLAFLAMFSARCQHSPTKLDSTYQPRDNGAATKQSENKTGEMNHSEMNHGAMQTAPDAASQPFDLQFLDTMIAHHQGALDMAKDAETKAQNADLKLLAAKITADQTREIAEMKKWRKEWFTGKPSAVNMNLAGMADSMRMMDVNKLNAASGAAFDLEFVNQMIPHHEGADAMAREALTKAEHAEIKTLANQIIAAQTAEIKQMQDWKAQWTK